jgi:hypothetical protein
MTRPAARTLAVLLALAGCTPPPAPAPQATIAPPAPLHTPPPRIVDLIDGPGDAVIAALGPPVLRRKEKGSEIWLYANANGCSIDVVLFGSGPDLRVAHATTRTPAALSEADCLIAIAAAAP